MKTHPLSAKGRYYVDTENCFCCTVCEETAPNNFKIDKLELTAFVNKQAKNLEEEKQCKKALNSCPHEAIHDDGEIKNL